MKVKSIFKKSLSVWLSLSMICGLFSGCKSSGAYIESEPLPSSCAESVTIGESENTFSTIETTQVLAVEELDSINNEISSQDAFTESIEQFATDLIKNEYEYCFDVFDAIIFLEDGTQIRGLGYSDYAAFYKADDSGYGFFPCGFIGYPGEPEVPEEEIEKGLQVYNQDFEDDQFQFVYSYETGSFYEHTVRNNQYIIYGVNDAGLIDISSQTFSKDICDLALGSLYSYDENKYLYDPNVGNYVYVTGTSLSTIVDYNDLEREVNAILENQDYKFSKSEVETIAYSAQKAINNYWLSLQEETFMGYKVSELLEISKTIDPTECIQFTPEGYLITDMNPAAAKTKEETVRWAVGATCGILVAGSIALNVFVPAARPLSGAITGAAATVFMQVVLEHQSVENINWNKVAVAAVSGALLAWACPLAGSKTAAGATKLFENKALGKLAGYGVLTLSNSLVGGATNAAMATIDGKSSEDTFNAFLVGAAIAGASTIAASALSEGGSALFKAVNTKFPNNFFQKGVRGAQQFVGKHQVHLKNSDLESILSPKSIHAAAEDAMSQVNAQSIANGTAKSGGKYSDLPREQNVTERHETPCYTSTGDKNRGRGPAICMDAADHKKTASFGNSIEARAYQNRQAELIKHGDYHDAIQMDIDDIRSKFGTKYDQAIDEMISYAMEIGWW